MRSTTHQTVHLGRGRHRSPDSGACVMELASMLGGECFGDRPACVSPVIGAVLRSYNDHLSDRHRQSLYRWAAEVVGTAGRPEVEQARIHRCLRAADRWRAERPRPVRWFVPPLREPRRNRAGDLEELGLRLVRLLRPRTRAGRERAEALIAELIAVGVPRPEVAPEPEPVG